MLNIKFVQSLLTKSDKKGRAFMYTTLDKIIMLKGVDLFSSLTADELFALAKIATEERYLNGEIIFNEGEPGDSMYVIIHGSVSVFNKRNNLAELSKGECFGEMALLDHEPRSSSIKANSDIPILKIDEKKFYDLIAENLQITQGIMRILSKRLRKSINN